MTYNQHQSPQAFLLSGKGEQHSCPVAMAIARSRGVDICVKTSNHKIVEIKKSTVIEHAGCYLPVWVTEVNYRYAVVQFSDDWRDFEPAYNTANLNALSEASIKSYQSARSGIIRRYAQFDPGYYDRRSAKQSGLEPDDDFGLAESIRSAARAAIWAQVEERMG